MSKVLEKSAIRRFMSNKTTKTPLQTKTPHPSDSTKSGGGAESSPPLFGQVSTHRVRLWNFKHTLIYGTKFSKCTYIPNCFTIRRARTENLADLWFVITFSNFDEIRIFWPHSHHKRLYKKSISLHFWFPTSIFSNMCETRNLPDFRACRKSIITSSNHVIFPIIQF